MAALFIFPVSDRVAPRQLCFSNESERRSFAEDAALIERIVTAYHAATGVVDQEIQGSLAGAVWGGYGYECQQRELIRALDAASLHGVHDILRRFFLSEAAHAIAMGRYEYDLLVSDPGHRACYGLQWIDRLVGLAFAVGARRIPNPEDDGAEAWERCLEVNVEEILEDISRCIGVPIDFPEICGVFGGRIETRPFPLIGFQHLVVAIEVCRWSPAANPVIVEIGGGFGGLAYFTSRLLNCRYTIVDLPVASAIQAYFLARALPGCELTLFGEAESWAGGILLCPPWHFLSTPPCAIDVAVSQDSLIEIPHHSAQLYLKAVRRCLRGPLLSIHPEMPAVADARRISAPVAEVVQRVGGFACRVRSPFFLRPGHLLEVFCVR
jgi:hypothetical protein